MSEHGTENWEYGFYDSHPDGNWYDEPKPQAEPVIYWYVFGVLTHKTAASAMHTGLKSTWGTPVIVRRRHGSNDWEHNPAALIALEDES